ncbi:sigma-70 family RNA polymerase sigma factor [Mangrovivirga sp. M17]|uniref:Sigma-70 family RNA polymerase sigma factor n=1 Tax=Mangrovivirga halotolerans TaxID=2993936 RepID=A0ABT3RLP1_9BACT|nr:sigma-70 family RNA polymerase sigma factor [Mangrovivirga halotolerans]MCX2742727.1 sigma-70 family RNA polymerase sigma factor [Mangrovivirga halotolerans]
MNENRFLSMIEAHQGIIYKISKMYRDDPGDQEDLFQDIVYQLWKSISSFKEDSKESTWIYKVALNTALASFRKRKVEINYTEDKHSLDHIEEESTSENQERLFSALRKLEKSDRALISLFLEGYSYKEIGEITGISVTYVGVRLNRIKTRLKEILLIKV